MLSTECSECSVVLLICFSLKALKTHRNQYCNGLKTLRGQVVYSFLFIVSVQ